MIPNANMMTKFTGNIVDESGAAGYRVAASTLVNVLESEVIKLFGDNKPPEPYREIVVSFVVAAGLELLPLSTLSDQRQRLAYNIRVRLWERLGDFVVGAVAEKYKPLNTLLHRIQEEGDRHAANLAEGGFFKGVHKENAHREKDVVGERTEDAKTI